MYFNATANCAYRETAELIAGHFARGEGGEGQIGKGDGTGKSGGGKGRGMRKVRGREVGGTRRPRFSGARAHGYRYFGVR